MFTTYRVPPLHRSGVGEGVRPLNAWIAKVVAQWKRLIARDSKPHGKCGSKLINAA